MKMIVDGVVVTREKPRNKPAFLEEIDSVLDVPGLQPSDSVTSQKTVKADPQTILSRL